VVEPSAWHCWKGILIENFKKMKKKKQKNSNNNFFFYLGSLKMELPKKHIFNIFKFDKLAEDYHLLLSSKPLKGDIFCLENIDF
jgi:hypothetical protein